MDNSYKFLQGYIHVPKKTIAQSKKIIHMKPTFENGDGQYQKTKRANKEFPNIK